MTSVNTKLQETSYNHDYQAIHGHCEFYAAYPGAKAWGIEWNRGNVTLPRRHYRNLHLTF